MSKTIEQVCGRDYDPPNYVWEDNTGEVIRYANCRHYGEWYKIPFCGLDIIDNPSPDDYCSRGERGNDGTR